MVALLIPWDSKQKEPYRFLKQFSVFKDQKNCQVELEPKRKGSLKSSSGRHLANQCLSILDNGYLLLLFLNFVEGCLPSGISIKKFITKMIFRKSTGIK